MTDPYAGPYLPDSCQPPVHRLNPFGQGQASAPAMIQGPAELGDLAARQQEAPEPEVLEVGHAVGGDRLAVRGLLARCPAPSRESRSCAANRSTIAFHGFHRDRAGTVAAGRLPVRTPHAMP